LVLGIGVIIRGSFRVEAQCVGENKGSKALGRGICDRQEIVYGDNAVAGLGSWAETIMDEEKDDFATHKFSGGLSPSLTK